jgi:hypothetical protein
LPKTHRKQFLRYWAGLIWIVQFVSIKEIARCFADGSTDSLHHFISNGSRSTQRLEQASQRSIAQRVDGEEEPILIIDDTAIARNGKHIQGIGIHHGADGFVRGQCVVTAVLKTTNQRLAWALRGYFPKRSCPVAEFKSKIELAREILQQAKQYFRHLTVLMDSWYSCAPILNLIVLLGWSYVAAVKKNRIVIRNGRRISVGVLAKTRLRFEKVCWGSRKKVRIARCVVTVPKIGQVVLFICKSAQGTLCLMSNHLDMTAAQAARLYRQRFDIELFHKEIKQHLHCGHLFVRSRFGAQKHWTLVGIAYNSIVLWNNGNQRSFRQTIRAFRSAIDPESMFMLPEHLLKTC